MFTLLSRKRIGLPEGKKLRNLGFHKITLFYRPFEEYLFKLNVDQSFPNKTVS